MSSLGDVPGITEEVGGGGGLGTDVMNQLEERLSLS